MNKYLIGAQTLKTESYHMQTLVPVAALGVVILATHGAASNN